MTIAVHQDEKAERLYDKISSHVDRAQNTIRSTIDTEMVKTYWSIGREIVEEEQAGEEKAAYGKNILHMVSARLMQNYGKGFSKRTLEEARRFYLEYGLESDTGKTHAVRAQLDRPVVLKNLGWTHYKILMRESRQEARRFYEQESTQNNWSTRELERQIHSLLYDRIAKSKDKEGVMQLALKGQEINNAKDAIKDPLILEFLSLPESNKLVESDLEEALISNLQHFLLELGKGFSFIGRQKRLTLEGDHFYADLVFYHVILKCYVILDIKMRKLQHADLGQMQLYVNYFDKEVKMDSDNPTIGLVLCTSKNETMVKYTLGDQNTQIFASRYQFHLPSEQELIAEIKKEIIIFSGQVRSS